MTAFNEMTLDDSGSRYKHYTELLDLWEDGLFMLKTSSKYYDAEVHTKRISELENAIALLRKQLNNLSNFPTDVYKLRPVIDDVHGE